MQRLQAFKYELMPTGEQQRQMRRFAGSCRFVFNKALALQKARHEQGDKKLGYAGRPASASPAVGYAHLHVEQQKALLDQAFGKLKGFVLTK